MHYVVADQKRCKRLVKMIQNIENARGPLIAIVRIAHHADAVYGCKRNLSPCKICAAKNQKENGYEIPCWTSVLHCGDQLL